MRYAVPLLDRPGAVTDIDHELCRRGDPCPQCLAQQHLTPFDWECVEFYRQVADQVVVLTPFGLKDGGSLWAPRLEAWEAVLRIYGYPRSEWPALVDAARGLHAAVHGRARAPEVWRLAPVDLKPTTLEVGRA